MANCERCDKKLNVYNRWGKETCRSCAMDIEDEKAAQLKAEEAKAGQYSADTSKARFPAIEAITVTTETHTDLVIGERLGIVTAECAYGMNAFKDLFASVRNIFGGRSEAVQATMRDARETVLYELKQEADRLGADAVIAVDLDYVQIGDGGWSMVMLVASGTAVKIEQAPT